MKANKKEIIRMSLMAMIEEGKKSGEISAYQLNEILSELEVEDDQRQNMIVAIEAMGICVLGLAGEDDTADPGEEAPVGCIPAEAACCEAIEMYLQEISELDLLNADEERALAQRVAAGDRAARETFLCSNLRLVVAVAKKFRGRGLPLDDLIQEGNIGLMKALDKFDHSKGNRFSTYAVWWIRNSIDRAIANCAHSIRRPAHVNEKINKMNALSQKFFQKRGYEPTEEELAQLMGMSLQNVLLLKWAAMDPVSIDTPIGNEDGTTLGSLLADNKTVNPDEASFDKLREVAVENTLREILTPREREVIRYRYGLADGTQWTLQKVAKKFGVTRERVRQIEENAMYKLRDPYRADELKEYAC